MKKYYFKAEKLRVGYGKQPLIENIEICLEKGEILTLIGPNGAGKSGRCPEMNCRRIWQSF